MRTAEAARYLKVSPEHLRDLVRKGKVRAYQRRRLYMFYREDLEVYIQNRKNRKKGIPIKGWND